jgi:tRNA 2-thiouridine synthesizing protein C
MARASVVAQLEALPLYDVDDIYVDEESLTARGLDVAQLALPVTRLKREEMAAFIAQHTPIIRF